MESCIYDCSINQWAGILLRHFDSWRPFTLVCSMLTNWPTDLPLITDSLPSHMAVIVTVHWPWNTRGSPCFINVISHNFMLYYSRHCTKKPLLKMSYFQANKNHLLTTGTGDPTLRLSPERQQGSSVSVVARWLWSGNIFRSGLHGGYLVDRGFFAKWSSEEHMNLLYYIKPWFKK